MQEMTGAIIILIRFDERHVPSTVFSSRRAVSPDHTGYHCSDHGPSGCGSRPLLLAGKSVTGAVRGRSSFLQVDIGRFGTMLPVSVQRHHPGPQVRGSTENRLLVR